MYLFITFSLMLTFLILHWHAALTNKIEKNIVRYSMSTSTLWAKQTKRLKIF